PDTLSNLALGNDLLQKVIETLRLGDTGSGELLPVESLASRMEISVQVSERSETVALPILTMKVLGPDPVQLKQIADTWAKEFVKQNALLFASESARSFDYLQTQFDEVRRALIVKNQEKLGLGKDAPPQFLKTELETANELYKATAITLTNKRAELAAARASQARLEEALAQEKPVRQFVRTIVDPETKKETTAVDEQENPTYVFLIQKVSEIASQVASLSAEVPVLEVKSQELRKSVQELSRRVAEIQADESTIDREIAVLASNLDLLAKTLQEARLAKEEETSSIRIVESAVVPRVPVGPNRRQYIVPAAAIGLLTGIVVALLVHYVQTGSLRAGRRPVSGG
ncbi:MAG: hypothetical protein HY531_01695, partial [Chloroflexi bacterium]|nr:hypothetical protein [Chloroflexota bacterium]